MTPGNLKEAILELLKSGKSVHVARLTAAVKKRYPAASWEQIDAAILRLELDDLIAYQWRPGTKPAYCRCSH